MCSGTDTTVLYLAKFLGNVECSTLEALVMRRVVQVQVIVYVIHLRHLGQFNCDVQWQWYHHLTTSILKLLVLATHHILHSFDSCTNIHSLTADSTYIVFIYYLFIYNSDDDHRGNSEYVQLMDYKNQLMPVLALERRNNKSLHSKLRTSATSKSWGMTDSQLIKPLSFEDTNLDTP